jgi:hypothetical protein
VHYVVGQPAEIRWHDGRIEKVSAETFDPLVENHLEYYRYLRGETARPATTLADCRPFVALNDLAHVSSGKISEIPAALVKRVRNPQDQKDYFEVAELSATQADFLVRGAWPSARGWGRIQPPPSVTPQDLGRFRDVIRQMAEKS